MTKYYDANPPYVTAADDMVLFDGTNMTGLGGRISSKDTAYLDTLQELTEAEASALLTDEEATEADYQAALADMGVTFDEES